MSDSASYWLTRGIAAARDRDVDEARFYLERALNSDPDHKQRVDAHYWLSEITDDPQQRRNYLEEILVHEPSHYVARRNLAILDGRLEPEQVVDPDQLAEKYISSEVQSRRYICQRCGGGMAFTGNGRSLACGYCGNRQSLMQALEQGALVPEEDFLLAMATAKGHTRPRALPGFHCDACGGDYLLSPQMLSLTCPYCSAVYVLDHPETHPIIPPEGIIPFMIDEKPATKAMRQWLKDQGMATGVRTQKLRGLYLPAWTFDLSGQIPWTCLRHDGENWVPYSGRTLIVKNDLLVPATHSLPAEITTQLDEFDLTGLVPYDPGYLADWPAETYQIAATDAAMSARWKAIESAQGRVAEEIVESITNLKSGPANVLIESYRLVLLPLWITRYQWNGKMFGLAVDGQSARIWAEAPARGLRGFLNRVFGST